MDTTRATAGRLLRRRATSPAGRSSPPGARWPGCSSRRSAAGRRRTRRSGLTVAGRTDAGVHATGQVCHVDLPTGAWEQLRGSLLRRLAALMPPDARVRAVTAGAGHLRRPLLGDLPPVRVPGRRHRLRPRAAAPPRHPRLGPAARPGPAATRPRPGWSASTTTPRTASARSTPPRSGRSPGWTGAASPTGSCVATVQADAFCQAMVRSLVGAMLTVGDGRREPAWPAQLLTPAGTLQRGDGRPGARPDPGRGRLPGRGRVRRPRRRHPPAARLTEPIEAGPVSAG